MTLEAIEHNSQENLNMLWDDLNYVYKYLSNGRYEWYQTIIDSFIKVTGIDLSGKRIADAGCASGNALRYIHDNHSPDSLTGFDFSPNALMWARLLLPNAAFITHDIEKPLKMKFDVIMCFQTLEHLSQPGLALENLMDALEDGGSLFLTVPDGATDSYVGHINRWTMPEFEKFAGAQHIGQLDNVILAVVVKELT